MPIWSEAILCACHAINLTAILSTIWVRIVHTIPHGSRVQARSATYVVILERFILLPKKVFPHFLAKQTRDCYRYPRSSRLIYHYGTTSSQHSSESGSLESFARYQSLAQELKESEFEISFHGAPLLCREAN